MTAEPLWLGLDIGTQSTKGLLVRGRDGEVVARASEGHRMIEGLAPGAAEQDPEDWVQAVRQVCRKLWIQGFDPRHVAGVGVSGQQHGLVVLDRQGKVVRPAKLWCDTSTAEEARELSLRLGRSVPTGYTASKILWLERHEPQHFARMATILLPHDWVNFRLTGRLGMEPGDASGTGLWDPVGRGFDGTALRQMGSAVESALPPLVESGQVFGQVHEGGAALTGLTEGTLVSTGGGDNMMSAAGAGATRPGIVVLSLGTSGTAFARTDHPVVDPQGVVAAFCDSAGGWLPLVCVMNVTGVTEEVRQGFLPNDALAHQVLSAEAEGVPPGCGGLTWLPFLMGERVPDLPHSTGVLAGLRPGMLRRGVLYRAALEGTSLNLAAAVRHLRRVGVNADRVRLVGGGAVNDLWRRVLATCLELPVVPVRESESAAFGAALHAQWTSERQRCPNLTLDQVVAPRIREDENGVEPHVPWIPIYREAQERFQDWLSRCFG